MTIANINIYTDGELEARAQSVLADVGLDMTTAINMFLTQMVDKRAFPFEIDAAKTVRKKPAKLPYGRGCMKGKMWMADDWDEPLEDFREYME